MAFNVESCSREEACVALGGSEHLLDELRDKLKDWLRLQPHLPQDFPEAFLESLLLGTKMSVERTKRKLDMYYTVRQLLPEIFAHRDPRESSLTNSHTMMEIAYLPKLTPEKYRVCIVRPCANDYSEYSAYDCIRYLTMVEEIFMNDPESRSLGNIWVFDHSMITLGLIVKYPPTVIRKCEIAAAEIYAIRIKGIHFINASPVTETLVKVFKQVLKAKLAARIHTHVKGQYESLYQYVPKSILPTDYGGEEPSLSHLAELWRQKVDENRDSLIEQEKIVVDERLRPGEAFNGDDLFGFSGSFRKLDVD